MSSSIFIRMLLGDLFHLIAFLVFNGDISVSFSNFIKVDFDYLTYFSNFTL